MYAFHGNTCQNKNFTIFDFLPQEQDFCNFQQLARDLKMTKHALCILVCGKTEITGQFRTFYSYPYLFHPPYLLSIFIQYFSLFLSLPLSHFATSLPHVLSCLSLLMGHSASSSSPSIQYLFPLSSLPPSKSPHYFPFSCTLLPRYLLRNFLCHTSLILSIVSGFFDSFPSFLLVCSTFIHLPFALNLSTSSLVYPFL
jgi:hypothetical protein